MGVSLDHAACLQESGDHDKIEEMGLKPKLTLIQGGGGGGGGKNHSVNLTLSVQWVGMDGFPKICQLLDLVSFVHFSNQLKLTQKNVNPLNFTRNKRCVHSF